MSLALQSLSDRMVNKFETVIDARPIHHTPIAAAWRPSLGAWIENDGVRFRVWAPQSRVVEVLFRDRDTLAVVRLDPLDGGIHAGHVRGAGDGIRYVYRLDGEPALLPDPASRSQPDGPHGWSEVIDFTRFRWSDGQWDGLSMREAVIYELHVGTFTAAGTFRGVQERLGFLKQLGVTAVELMPVAEFAGRWNWGYDGVDLFAPSHRYGRPDDLRHLINAAHQLGIAVILDVVYNHFGPDGAYLASFCPYYLTDQHRTPWGDAVNIGGPHSDRVREFILQNALHWVHEYHVDGLRLDAFHELHDDSQAPLYQELAHAVHTATPRRTVVIAEDERCVSAVADRLSHRSLALDGLWSDDFHHHLRRHLAGDHEGYFQDYDGAAASIARTMARGWFFDGQIPTPRGIMRGSDPNPLDLDQFVFCIQNHDQIGNRPQGDRLHDGIDSGSYRAASALLLLAPETPLLFMGQEWGASSPFGYFTDHDGELGRSITEGRRAEFAAFSAFRDGPTSDEVLDPQAESTFDASRLRWNEITQPGHARLLRLYRTLLAFRAAVLNSRDRRRSLFRACAADEQTVVLWWLGNRSEPIAVVARLNGSGSVRIAIPPDLPPHLRWTTVFTTDDPSFADDVTPPTLHIENDHLCFLFASPAAVVIRGGWEVIW